MEREKAGFLEAYDAALKAVAPEPVTAAALDALVLPSPVTVVAMGKAAPAMARGAVASLTEPPREILVISDHTEAVPPGARLMLGSHPTPDARSQAAGLAALEAAAGAEPDGSILFLISGGGSSLLEFPADGVTVADIADTADLVMASGLPINSLNTIRRHLSQVKNGQLLAAARARRAVTLAISDVVAAPPSAIASGPTIRDDTSPGDALEILRDHGLLAVVPASVISVLESRAQTGHYEGDHHIEVVADGHRAAAAAVRRLDELGIAARAITEDLLGYSIAAARSVCNSLSRTAVVLSGETTMTVTGDGRGGRNQSAALAASLVLDEGADAVFAALATDGIDGPTDAAGAIVDHQTVGAIRAAGLDPQHRLGDDDAYPALAAADALVITGPSGTNVSDLWMGWRDTD